MHHHIGNLFEIYEAKTLEVIQEQKSNPNDVINIIMHGCNAQGKMGSGFAKELRSRFPGAYDVYEETFDAVGLTLGDTVFYVDEAEGSSTIIANCITQDRYGYDGKKYVSYDGIDLCMTRLNDMIPKLSDNVHLHFPTLGADLGGGNWEVIRAIIDTRITNATKHLYTLK